MRLSRLAGPEYNGGNLGCIFRLRTVSQLSATIEKLDRAQQVFLRAAANIPEELWRESPGLDAWSGAEVVAHVMGVETTVVDTAQHILAKDPKRIPLLKRFSLPPALVERRTIRIKSPIPINRSLVTEQKVMLMQWTEVRGRTLRVIEETKNRDLRVYRWRHPVLGMLHGYGWFSFLASHQIRHAKQLEEIAAALRKAVAGLQK
jgi:hypothetical protein